MVVSYLLYKWSVKIHTGYLSWVWSKKFVWKSLLSLFLVAKLFSTKKVFTSYFSEKCLASPPFYSKNIFAFLFFSKTHLETGQNICGSPGSLFWRSKGKSKLVQVTRVSSLACETYYKCIKIGFNNYISISTPSTRKTNGTTSSFQAHFVAKFHKSFFTSSLIVSYLLECGLIWNLVLGNSSPRESLRKRSFLEYIWKSLG